MSKFTVTLPIAGHAVVEVEADTKSEAISEAMEIVEDQHITDWEPLEQFVSGAINYCPTPHRPVVEETH